jgi:hypothetical protein
MRHYETLALRVDETPRRLEPRSAVAHREREPGRLQLRFVLDVDEHMHAIDVVENDDSVVVFATVCTPVTRTRNHLVDAPFHVYLEQPLGQRRVVDAISGRDVPYRNVLAEVAEEHGLQYGGDPCGWVRASSPGSSPASACERPGSPQDARGVEPRDARVAGHESRSGLSRRRVDQPVGRVAGEVVVEQRGGKSDVGVRSENGDAGVGERLSHPQGDVAIERDAAAADEHAELPHADRADADAIGLRNGACPRR